MIFKRLVLLFSLIFIVTAAQGHADEYSSDPNVYELTPSTFDKVVHKSNYTTIVKFYAPWCGYCKQLKPIYKKLAKFIHQDGQYAVNVASVNCDKDSNKALCAKYQVQGFPTLMVFRPPKVDSGKQNKQRHATEVYNGERTVKAMSSFLTSRLKNYVKRFPSVQSDGLKAWLSEDQDSKFLLVTSSQQISPLLKSLAIDFLDVIQFASATTKLDKVSSIQVDGKDVKLPSDTNLPVFLHYDKSEGKFVIYDKTPKLNDKSKIAEWIIEVTGKKPREGSHSARDKKVLSYYRKSQKPPKKEKKVEHDEL